MTQRFAVKLASPRFSIHKVSGSFTFFGSGPPLFTFPFSFPVPIYESSQHFNHFTSSKDDMMIATIPSQAVLVASAAYCL